MEELCISTLNEGWPLFFECQCVLFWMQLRNWKIRLIPSWFICSILIVGHSTTTQACNYMEQNLPYFDHLPTLEWTIVDILHTTGSSRLMRISLLRISLLRFFKTFQTYLANAFFGLFISLMQFLGYFWPKKRTNEINSPKNALGKSQ